MTLTSTHPWRGFRPFKRHSLVLMVAGLVYVFIGGAYIVTIATAERQVSLQYALNWLPMRGWGVLFVLAGLLACISSRWPPISRTWGYTVLTGLSAAWSGFYAAGVLFSDSPRGNLTAALTWALIAFLWWAISGLVNPDDGT